jgi:hypothetical protein
MLTTSIANKERNGTLNSESQRGVRIAQNAKHKRRMAQQYPQIKIPRARRKAITDSAKVEATKISNPSHHTP